MQITARVSNSASGHRVEIATNGQRQPLAIPAKASGRGSSVNGGELLCAALATCFCNDLHRESVQRGIAIDDVDVEVSATFGGPGEPARDISYRVRVGSPAPAKLIDELIRHTDTVTEVQNTLRAGCAVRIVHEDATRT